MRYLTLRLRTRRDLSEVLRNGESPAWKIGRKAEPKIEKVEIVKFDGTEMIKAKFDPAASKRRADGRLIVRFTQGRIVPCKIKFPSRNPLRYIPDHKLRNSIISAQRKSLLHNRRD